MPVDAESGMLQSEIIVAWGELQQGGRAEPSMARPRPMEGHQILPSGHSPKRRRPVPHAASLPRKPPSSAIASSPFQLSGGSEACG